MYGDSEFDTLVKDFCLKDDLNLKQDIIRLSNKLNLLIDKDKYLDNYFDIYNDTFLNNVVSKYERLIRDNVLELQGIYNELQKYISFDLVKKLDDYFSVLFNAHCYEEHLPILSLSLPRFVGVDELGLCYKEELKSKIDDIKKLLKYDSNLDMVNSIKDTFKYINVIIKIIRELDKRICEYKFNNNSFEFNDIALMAIKIVKDNEDIREEIFNRFVQEDKSFNRKKEGSGIGLALVKSLVELHDGEVYLEDVSEGSEFVVKLPNIKINEEVNNHNRVMEVESKPLVQKINIEFSDIYSI